MFAPCSGQEDGSGLQLVTPPLDGTILPGVTRDSVLQLARHWRDCEVLEAHITVGTLKKVDGHYHPACSCMQFPCIAWSNL